MNTHQRILVLVILSFTALPAIASAATVSLRATPTAVGVGDVVRVSVLLDSFAPTNTFSGVIRYPEAVLEPLAVHDGSSIINLWITHPAVPATGASIPFAGITPGGFSGSDGILFSILFRAKATGTANVSLSEIKVLRNDGAGEEEPVTTRSLSLSVGPEPRGGYTEPVDRTPPEPFTIYLGADERLFEGREYIVFTAVDKLSGIDHYAVAESRVPSFLTPLLWNEPATSPYVLNNQNRTSTLFVKAIDRAGNERLSIFPPQHLATPYERGAFLGILIAFVFLWQMRGRGRRFRKNP